MSQSIASDMHNEEWKQKIEKMKQEFDTEKAVQKIEIEESHGAIDIHNIIRKYGSSGKDHSWAYELNDMEGRQKPSYLSEADTESVLSNAAVGQ